ncbi:protein fem-1 homolog C-like isoform X1 [Tachypleus tridentatus]|uniref:protein fem-1 homolog C-like isoform X1 n=2 Tax=Tachypleus tridentatus TaxID=6853 RepID=UPI003FCF262D
MEFKNVVFNAARDGKYHRLKMFLDNRPKEEIHMLVSTPTNGATPLVVASRNGHVEVVEYLITKCGADIEQVGSVIFDNETIEGAPALWCAAAAGHLAIVKSLISHGACVNSTTKTNSTPLRAACFDGHYQIVEYLVEKGADIEIANRHGHTCLMIACYKGHLKIAKFLVEHNAQTNRKSVKGNTALHDCAESGSLEILKLLLQHGAKMDIDSYGMTPLLAAAVTGHTAVAEYLISLSSCSRKEKIDALELLGATYVDKKRDMKGALDLWKRAMEERTQFPFVKKLVLPHSVPAYNNAVEVDSVEKLDKLICDPDEMRMQALLVRERILGPAHPDTSYYIRYRGAVYADTDNFERCIGLWMYALDMQQKILEPLNPMTHSSLVSFAELFSFMMSDTWANRRRCGPSVAFYDIQCVFHKALKEIEAALNHMKKMQPAEREFNNFHRTLVIVMHLIGLLCRLEPHLSIEEKENLKRSVYKLVKLGPRGCNGLTPLHLACLRESSSLGRYPVCTFPSPEVVELLLEVGASPNIVDNDGNTPLHITALNKPSAHRIFKMLLNYGGHLDACNAKGETALNLTHSIALLDVFPVRHLTLKCLAARVINKQDLPFKELIPLNLVDFVLSH